MKNSVKGQMCCYSSEDEIISDSKARSLKRGHLKWASDDRVWEEQLGKLGFKLNKLRVEERHKVGTVGLG